MWVSSSANILHLTGALRRRWENGWCLVSSPFELKVNIFAKLPVQTSQVNKTEKVSVDDSFTVQLSSAVWKTSVRVIWWDSHDKSGSESLRLFCWELKEVEMRLKSNSEAHIFSSSRLFRLPRRSIIIPFIRHMLIADSHVRHSFARS